MGTPTKRKFWPTNIANFCGKLFYSLHLHSTTQYNTEQRSTHFCRSRQQCKRPQKGRTTTPNLSEILASEGLVIKAVVLKSVISVAASWRGVGMDAEIDNEGLAGAIAVSAAVGRWPPEQQLLVAAAAEVTSPDKFSAGSGSGWMGGAEEPPETNQRRAGLCTSVRAVRSQCSVRCSPTKRRC